MTITEAEMESRRRVARLKSRIDDVIGEVLVNECFDLTYAEANMAVAQVLLRLAQEMVKP